MLSVPKETILASSFLSILVDKVTVIDNLNWISIHMVGWRWVPILFRLERLLEGGFVVNIKVIKFSFLMKFGHFSKNQVA